MSSSPRLALAAAVLFACAACSGGSGGGTPDGGTDGGSNGQTDQAYFGLTDGTCYGFLQAGGTAGRPPDATLGIQTDNTLGFPALRMDYRVGGFVLRTDFVTVEGGKVLLHRREDTGSPGMKVDLQPAPRAPRAAGAGDGDLAYHHRRHLHRRVHREHREPGTWR